MGVLNMSVESNYTPSVHGVAAEAAEYVDEVMVPEGADIVDVGLQSSNPKNDWFPEETELDRLDAALDMLDRVETEDVLFSIETRYATVAERAIEGGFDIVNDVCGFADPDMPDVCERYDVPVVKMASPPDLKRPGHLKDIDAVFEALEREGFTDKTIIDPAFGGWYDDRTYEDNWELFRRMREFRAFGRPILTATNREDFLGDIADRPDTEDQLPVSLAAATMEVERGANVVRTHDIADTVDVVAIAHALGDDRVVESTRDARAVELTDVSLREVERHFSVRETVDDAGAPADGTTLTFLVSDLADETRTAVVDAAVEHDLSLALDDDSLFLSGTARRLGHLADDLGGRSEALSTVAGTLRRGLTRRV
nr:dihydropteroate synthase [Halomarina rubra]